MAPRKSPDDAWCSIVMLRTTEFMMASQVGGVVGALQQVLQDRAFQRGKLGRATTPGTGDIDVDVVRDATVLYHEDPVGKCYGFRYVMRHQDRREGLILPDSFQQPLHRD